MGTTDKPSLFAGTAAQQSAVGTPTVVRPHVAPVNAPHTAPPAAALHPIPQQVGMPYGYAPKPTLMQRLHMLTGLGNFLIFAYIFLGEVFLPDHLRATTFLGSRLGGIQGQQAEYAAPQQAKAAAMIDTAKADVEVIKQCEILRRQTSYSVYGQCLNGPNGSHPMCLLQQEMYLDTFQCNAAGEILNHTQNSFQDF